MIGLSPPRERARRWRVTNRLPRGKKRTRILGRIPAGTPDSRREHELGKLAIDLSAIGIPTTENTFALEVRGDSMVNAGINDGDVVLVERREPHPGEIVAMLIDHEVTLKRFIEENGKRFLRAENPKYPDLIPAEEMVGQGVVVGLIRRF